MGIFYYIKIGEKCFYIGKSNRGWPFHTNIFDWYKLVVYLDKDDSLTAERLLFYTMCKIAKNTQKTWDGKELLEKNVKAAFRRVLDKVDLVAGKIYREDDEDDTASSEDIFDRIFNYLTDSQKEKMLKPQFIVFTNRCDLLNNGCKKCKRSEYHVCCESCKPEIFKKYYALRNNFPQVVFSFEFHVIAGVFCKVDSEYS